MDKPIKKKGELTSKLSNQKRCRVCGSLVDADKLHKYYVGIGKQGYRTLVKRILEKSEK